MSSVYRRTPEKGKSVLFYFLIFNCPYLRMNAGLIWGNGRRYCLFLHFRLNNHHKSFSHLHLFLLSIAFSSHRLIFLFLLLAVFSFLQKQKNEKRKGDASFFFSLSSSLLSFCDKKERREKNPFFLPFSVISLSSACSPFPHQPFEKKKKKKKNPRHTQQNTKEHRIERKKRRKGERSWTRATKSRRRS